MSKEWETVNERKKLKTILLIAIIAVVSIATITLSTTWTLPALQTPNTPTYTTTYNNITAQETYNLVYNDNHPLIIIDMRNCKCSYDKGHITGAVWQTNPITFYNSTIDILVYGEDALSLLYCQELTGHTYGAIYHLEGGIDAWENAGYRTTKL